MKLCVALDLSSKKENLILLEKIKFFDVWIKVGLRSYIRDGKDFIKDIKSINHNFKIFLDLKLYDIPNTMADTAEEIAKLNIDMFNIHASSGLEAMKTVMQRLERYENKPLVLAVTALTSFDEDGFNKVYNSGIKEKAIQFAKDSYESGLDGVVCSVQESKIIKDNTGNKFLTLTPGIRPFGEDSNDQKRVATVEVAENELVDFIVVGRPIYKAENPAEIIEKILSKIN